jgi:hypothetical protein
MMSIFVKIVRPKDVVRVCVGNENCGDVFHFGLQKLNSDFISAVKKEISATRAFKETHTSIAVVLRVSRTANIASAGDFRNTVARATPKDCEDPCHILWRSVSV